MGVWVARVGVGSVGADRNLHRCICERMNRFGRTQSNPLAKAEAFVPVPFVAMSKDRGKGFQFPDIGSSRIMHHASCIMISRAHYSSLMHIGLCSHIMWVYAYYVKINLKDHNGSTYSPLSFQSAPKNYRSCSRIYSFRTTQKIEVYYCKFLCKM